MSPADNGIEWRAQLVREHREELIFDTVRNFCARARLLFEQHELFQLVFGIFTLAMKFDMRLDTGQKLARGKWLDEIIVGTCAHTFNTRLLTRTCREQNDGNRSRLFVTAQCLQQTKSVEFRHHHVRQHEIESLFASRPDRSHTITYCLYFISAGKQTPDVVAHVGIIVSQQNARPIFRLCLSNSRYTCQL